MSLTARLSAFFLTILALVLLGFSVGLYQLASRYLHHQAEDRLRTALDTLLAAAELEPRTVEWCPEEHHLTLGRDSAPDQVRWMVHDDHGRLVDRSANLGAEVLEFAGSGDVGGEAVFHRGERDGQPWQLAQRRLQAPAAPGVPEGPSEETREPAGARKSRHTAIVVTAGLSLAPVATILHRLTLTLAGLSVGLWLVAAVLGRWLCRRGLLPVTRMAASARAMSAADLQQRLPRSGTHDELEDLGQAFNDLLGRLQESFERQRRFTGDASHQLRTPLTALLGQIEVALRRDRPAEEYRHVLGLVHGQAVHLRQIVEALLFLARADAEARLSHLEALDPGAWLSEHLTRWSQHPRQGDLLIPHAREAPLLVRVQAPLLGQLLDNLLDNACKFSRPGTPITVRLERERDAVLLSVEDQGRGIAAEDLPHVFEPFYRSPQSRQRGDPGVGLGLAVAQRIATAFGGSLTVSSEPDRGSRFTLRFPAVSSPDDERLPDTSSGRITACEGVSDAS